MNVRAMIVAAALALPAAAQAPGRAERDKPAYRPPVADEAHGLKGAERELALHVERAHYRNLIEVFDGLEIPGRDPKDPSKPARCALRLEIRPEDYRPGSFVAGVPVRRAQPVVFNSVQQQLVGWQTRCGSEMTMTVEGWRTVEDAGLELLERNSGTTYCRADSDCYGAELTVDPCGARRSVRVFGSNTTDAVLFVAWRKFMPPLTENFRQMVIGSVGALGDRHPDAGVSGSANACPMKHWEETPLRSVCVEHSCRAAP